MDWLENNSTAEKEDYESKEKDLQQVCSPIMAKVHGQQQCSDNGPTVEEVD